MAAAVVEEKCDVPWSLPLQGYEAGALSHWWCRGPGSSLSAPDMSPLLSCSRLFSSFLFSFFFNIPPSSSFGVRAEVGLGRGEGGQMGRGGGGRVVLLSERLRASLLGRSAPLHHTPGVPGDLVVRPGVCFGVVG